MHRFLYILFLLLSFSCVAQDQDKKYVYRDSSLLQTDEEYDTLVTISTVAPPTEEAVGTTTVEKEETTDTTLRLNYLTVPADSVRQWKEMKAFAYVKYMDSLLKDRQDKERKKAKENFGPPASSLLDRFLSSAFTQVFLWTLAGCFILFIIYRLFLAEGAFRRETKTARPAAPEMEEEGITPESDFDALISLATRNNNYRQAVRYQYLKVLHKLADRNLVELAPDKTNYQYVREISRPELRNEFASLTLNYEYVWYGEFAIEKNIYQKLEDYFSRFGQKL